MIVVQILLIPFKLILKLFLLLLTAVLKILDLPFTIAAVFVSNIISMLGFFMTGVGAIYLVYNLITHGDINKMFVIAMFLYGAAFLIVPRIAYFLTRLLTALGNLAWEACCSIHILPE